MVRDLLDMLADFVKRVAGIFTEEYMVWSNVCRQLVYLVFVLGILPLVIITMSFGFYNAQEKMEATGLRKAFEKFGKRSRYNEKS